METALYLHIPFCRHRCAYCDFNTYAGLEGLMSPYMAALGREITGLSGKVSGNICTIFLGGGTPSLVPIAMLADMFRQIRAAFSLSPDVEITLEANPGTVSPEYLSELRALGVNRLSMGMQSASPDDLRVLERSHDFLDVANAVTWARRAGFDNVNLDLIFGVPYQTMARWQQTLELALGLGVEHLSIYSLILEHGTPMNAWVERGLLTEPDDDLAADMYAYTRERLPKDGFEQYEISNYARRNADGVRMACRHNLQYWRDLPYLGLGAGAHGYAGGVRTANVRAPRAYIERLKDTAERPFPRTPATVNAAPVTRRDEMGEVMMMGLRLVEEGVSDEVFRVRFGMGLLDAFPAEIANLLDRGLLTWSGPRLHLTERGIFLGNQAFMAFVGD